MLLTNVSFGVPGGNFINTSCCPVILVTAFLNAFQLSGPVGVKGIFATNFPYFRSSSHTSKLPAFIEETANSIADGDTVPNSTPEIINHPPRADVLVTTGPDFDSV
jgi:hypothetical protein